MEGYLRRQRGHVLRRGLRPGLRVNQAVVELGLVAVRLVQLGLEARCFVGAALVCCPCRLCLVVRLRPKLGVFGLQCHQIIQGRLRYR